MRKKRWLAFSLTLAFTLVLAACAQPAAPVEAPEVDTSGAPSAELEVERLYGSEAQVKVVDGTMKIVLDDVEEGWKVVELFEFIRRTLHVDFPTFVHIH